MQCWTLSTIPSAPRVFPSENLYTNIDYLLSRTTTGGNMEKLTRVFPWIIWYIWKARNKKLYNGRDFSSVDTIDLETRECIAWFLSNEEIEPGESTIECIPSIPPEVPTFIVGIRSAGTTQGIVNTRLNWRRRRSWSRVSQSFRPLLGS